MTPWPWWQVFKMWFYFLFDALSRSAAMAIVFDITFSIDLWYAYFAGFVFFWFVFDLCLQSCINRGGEDQICNDSCPDVSPLSAAMSVFSSFPLSTQRKDRRRLFYVSTTLTLALSFYVVGPALARHGGGKCGLLDTAGGPYWTEYSYKGETIKAASSRRRQRREEVGLVGMQSALGAGTSGAESSVHVASSTDNKRLFGTPSDLSHDLAHQRRSLQFWGEFIRNRLLKKRRLTTAVARLSACRSSRFLLR